MYIFAGIGEDQLDLLNSIEKISVDSLVPNGRDTWKLILVPNNAFKPRQSLALAPLNDTEIVILGGTPDISHDANLGDVVVFDTISEKFKEVVSGADKIVQPVIKKKPVKKEEKKQSITKKKTKVGFGGGISVQVKKV